MLEVPSKVSKHKRELDIVSDWIESSVLFSPDEDEISRYDVIDVILDADVFADQNDAHTFMSDTWEALYYRQRAIGSGSPFTLTNDRISRVREWTVYPAYSFCLLLSFAVWSRLHTKWQNQIGGGYALQGELFERLTASSLVKQFPHWEFDVIGWSRSNTDDLPQTIRRIGRLVKENEGHDYSEYINPHSAKDVGLDVLGYRSFEDNRGALPIYLVQCATGENWNTKLDTPDVELWSKIVTFTAKPARGFAMPFSLLETDKSRDFKLSAFKVAGLFLDRYRLLSASIGSANIEDWIGDGLKSEIISWVEPRLQTLSWE